MFFNICKKDARGGNLTQRSAGWAMTVAFNFFVIVNTTFGIVVLVQALSHADPWSLRSRAISNGKQQLKVWRKWRISHSPYRVSHPKCQPVSHDGEAANNVLYPEIVFSSFWGSTTVNTTGKLRSQSLPCVPSMDNAGFLPHGAYVLSPSFSPVCRTSFAIDLQRHSNEDDLEPREIVQAMQRFVDDGLTSFQLEAVSSSRELVAWGEEQLYRRFLQETPATILRQTHLTVPIAMSSLPDVPVNRRAIRTQLANSLHRMGSPDFINCAQIFFPQGQESSSSIQYYSFMETLDALEDFKREGLVLSVAGRNIPPSVVQSAYECGFSSLCRNQLDVNLVDPSKYSDAKLKFDRKEFGLPLQATAPIMGGLLSDKFVGRLGVPATSDLSWNAQRHLRCSLSMFAKQRRSGGGIASTWRTFQTALLPVLEDMSHKHCVSIASIALRWILQRKHIESLVVSTRLSGSDETGAQRISRKQQYRDVFRFELDDDDMERLWEISTVVGNDREQQQR